MVRMVKYPDFMGTNRMRAIVQKIAILFLALTSLYSLFISWRKAAEADVVQTGPRAIDAWEARLQPVRKSLPISRGTIGYLVEWDVPGMKYSPGDLEAEYLLSQYALAPFILLRSPDAEWNVALLDLESIHNWEQAHPGQYEIITLRRNVFLLHRLED